MAASTRPVGTAGSSRAGAQPANMPTPHPTGPPAAAPGMMGNVSYGRSSTARFTGSRALISPRLALGAGRGAVRGRTWIRTHGVDQQPTGGDPIGLGDPRTPNPSSHLSAPPAAGPHAW